MFELPGIGAIKLFFFGIESSTEYATALISS
jgi:hypothetical protein